VVPIRRSVGSSLLLITALLACPCHGAITLPLLVALFGGTALGTWLSTHTGLVVGLSAAYFLTAIVLGFWLLNRRSPECGATCSPPQRHQPNRPLKIGGSLEYTSDI
jgi:mercuric ion transport protein